MPKKKKDKAVELFLDSGAFSAFTQGVEIDIQEYIAFIKKHKQHLSVYANLDVIGCAEGTWKNQRIMEKAGLSPLPCFHYGEPIEFLERYVEKYDYIALGGMVPVSTKDLAVWLDTIFSEHICDKNGMPKVQVHGFGLTSLRLMLRYPWYSVDSTSWVVTGRLGSIFIPRRRAGVYEYGEDSWKVQVSTRSPAKKEAGKHLDNFSPLQKKVILDYIEEKGFVLGESSFRMESEEYELEEDEKWVGKKADVINGQREVETIKIAGLSNDYRERDKLNIQYFLDLEASMSEWPWAFRVEVKDKGFGF